MSVGLFGSGRGIGLGRGWVVRELVFLYVYLGERVVLVFYRLVVVLFFIFYYWL